MNSLSRSRLWRLVAGLGLVLGLISFFLFVRDNSAHLDEWNATEGYWTAYQAITAGAAFILIAGSVVLFFWALRRGQRALGAVAPPSTEPGGEPNGPAR
ncbi:MAG: hypothetical protein LBJ02_11505 [Bifidobacteriaceae bacterium]|nr:hypothetical protein [Bifidobacteriaceae bacterium]